MSERAYQKYTDAITDAVWRTLPRAKDQPDMVVIEPEILEGMAVATASFIGLLEANLKQDVLPVFQVYLRTALECARQAAEEHFPDRPKQ